MKTRPLASNESDLVGKWIECDGEVVGDATCDRIDWLVSNVLREVSADPSGWDVLYLDPADGRYWELTYPQSEMHGGGPPRFKYIDVGKARKKYKL